jgi:predicted Fe-Mo cluster-binding NifX family protein
MKVAIAKDGDKVSGHFGHCSEYAVYTIEDSKVIRKEILKNPGHEPGLLPALLAQQHVTHVLAGGMGPRAVDVFCAQNIEVFLGIAGPVDGVIRDFIAGKVTPGQSSCHHSGECGH